MVVIACSASVLRSSHNTEPCLLACLPQQLAAAPRRHPAHPRCHCQCSLLQVTATGVVKQNGGISGGVSSPVKFTTGAQFTITDPAVMQVGCGLSTVLPLLPPPTLYLRPFLLPQEAPAFRFCNSQPAAARMQPWNCRPPC